MKNAKVAVIACGLEMAKTETKGTVLIKSAKDLKEFSVGEEHLMEEVRNAVAAHQRFTAEAAIVHARQLMTMEDYQGNC